MSDSRQDDVVPLTGADCFLRAFEAEVRRTAKASHLSQLVLRLGPGFDVEAFRRLVEEVSRANPIAAFADPSEGLRRRAGVPPRPRGARPRA